MKEFEPQSSVLVRSGDVKFSEANTARGDTLETPRQYHRELTDWKLGLALSLGTFPDLNLAWIR